MNQVNTRNKNPVLSVIIPAYNAEQWIKKAIDSALNCTIRPLEILVVDDGSTDNTSTIASEYSQSVILIRQKNSGVAQARKTGVQSARGKYIKFLDADDLLPPGELDFCLSIAECYPGEVFLGRAVVFTCSSNIQSEGMYSIGYKPNNLSLVRSEFLLTQATHSGVWLIPSIIFKRNAIFDDDNIQLGEEYSFCMRLVNSNVPIRYIDKVVYLVRNHNSESRLSKSKDESRHILQVNLISESYEFIKNKIPSPSSAAFTQIARVCWSNGRECLRIGCRDAALRYFELSRRVDCRATPSGSFIYRALCRAVGPYASEAVLQVCKSIIGRR